MEPVIAAPNQNLYGGAFDFYPESPADEGWLGDDEVLRSHALSVCANAWALVYTPLIDGPKPARTASA
jgi:hypothetical protein